MFLKSKQPSFDQKGQQEQNPAIGNAFARLKFQWGFFQFMFGCFVPVFDICCPYTKYVRYKYISSVAFVRLATIDVLWSRLLPLITIFF